MDEASALQEYAGLEIVTDGEMRRLSFQGQMTEAVDEFGEHDMRGIAAFIVLIPSRDILSYSSGAELGITLVDCSVAAFGQGRTKERIPFAGLAAPVFSGAFVVSRTHAGP